MERGRCAGFSYLSLGYRGKTVVVRVTAKACQFIAAKGKTITIYLESHHSGGG